MVLIRAALVILIALAACKPSHRELRALAGADLGCVCPEDAGIDAPPDAAPDAPVDATPDAPPVVIDLAAPWIRTIITAGINAVPFKGADGVAFDAEGCISTGWEEGKATTRACPTPAGGWATEVVATNLASPEDAHAADLDGDGAIDVVTCADYGALCYITFRGAFNVTVPLAASMGHRLAVQSAIADVDNDGLPDIVFGTRAGTVATPAVIAWLRNPGAAAARDDLEWTYHQISLAGWTMSLFALDVDLDGDIDVVTSDRTSYKDAGGVTRWGAYGAHWKEQTAGGWVDHEISLPAGSTAGHTPGDMKFLTIVDIDGDGDLDVVDCVSAPSRPDSRITIERNDGAWLAWTHTLLPTVTNVAKCQGLAVADLDQDGDLDIAVSGWKGDAYPIPAAVTGTSGVYWLRNEGAGVYSRGEVSGAEGGKWDNIIARGNCLYTSEQLDPQGGLGVVRFCPPWGP